MTKEIEAGDFVKVKPRDVSANLGIDFRMRGFEAKVLKIFDGPRGQEFQVQVLRNGRTRFVQRAQLMLHKESKKKPRRR